jgi:hypothetical protein
MNNITYLPPEELSPRQRAAEIAAIVAAAIARTQSPTVLADNETGLGFLPGQSVHATPSLKEL